MTDTSKSTDDTQDVHRLRDIVVEEVSLVDRAANKRRFLVVKRSMDMAGTVNPDEEDTQDETDDVKKAKKKPKPEDAAGDDPEVTPEKQAKTTIIVAEGDDDDDEDEEEDGEGSETEDAAEEEPAAKKKASRQRKQSPVALQTVTEALKRLMTVAKHLQNCSPNAEISLELAAVSKLLSPPAAAQPKASLHKAGARMARGRLDRFHKAIELLSSILKELTASDEVPTGEPTAGAAESRTKSGPAATAASGVTELATEMQKLARVVKRQEEELSHMRQARTVSNAMQVDGGRRTEAADVSWPFDMNRPISRDKVRKEVSFFDE